MLARTVMIQGTASSVGKSLITTALCRMLAQDGLRVAPFKAQNMALNAFVTPDGGEIGRAQAVQAEAAHVEPHVDMNPILLKPEGDARAQVVVLGKAIGSAGALEYHAKKPDLRRVVVEALNRLREAYDVVVIEGAGSPAEINLKDRDLVNMFVAKAASAPVLLVGDIDRGGVFASFVGTMELLEPDERARVAAFVVNKFRGDVKLLEPGLDFLRARTGVPVLGVVPWVPRLRVADEDSVSLDARASRRRPPPEVIDVAVVRLPRISNYDDVEALEHEPGVAVRFVEHEAAVREADLVIVPGTKSTIADLAWMRARGIADAIVRRAEAGGPVLGVCGGCQMLGARVDDPDRVESDEPSADGLGLLPIRTRFARTKTAAQVRARAAIASLFGEPIGDAPLDGYEIHMGRVEHAPGAKHAFDVERRSGEERRARDGAVSDSGAVVGTLVHGLLENEPIRAALLRALRRRRALPAPPASAARVPSRQEEYDRLARIVRESLDAETLARILGG